MTSHGLVSLELLCLINWLLEHDKATLEAMVKRAIESGFIQDMHNLDSLEASSATENMYPVLFDLLEFWESCLVDNLSAVKMDSKTEKSIVPMLQKLETGNIDLKTLWLSMEQTKTRIHEQEVATSKEIAPSKTENSQENPQDILVTQLLKNWKPDSSETLN